MGKQTREEKRAEERRVIAEMEAAMREKEGENSAEESAETAEDALKAEEAASQKTPQPKKKSGFHCPKCKTALGEDGRCPTCGYKMYIPMDEKKRNKIKLIVTVVAMAIFIVLFVILQFKK